MIAQVSSAAYLGIHSYPVNIEVDVSNGLPQLNVVGLPDQSIKESKERIRSAIKNSGYHFPVEKITINLAPADIKKEGPAFDLPMALGILAATGVISLESLERFIFLGELALDGSLRPFKGSVVIANGLKKSKSFIFPVQSAKEACVENDAEIYPAHSLKEVIDFLEGKIRLQPLKSDHLAILPNLKSSVDFSEVKGQFFAKRAIEIAVAGGHNLLLIGPPGSGKTMLARRIPTILPPLDFEDALEITKIYSVAGLGNFSSSVFSDRPFRDPHYSISPVALCGGGSWPKPGEISLAHGGVLFLDEFPQFRRDVLESLRSPLEEGEITISRVKMQVTYPARIMLVAAMNPCPCGFLSDPQKNCRCSLGNIQKYQSRLSGPILDRIDLHVTVPALTYAALTNDDPAEASMDIAKRIEASRALQAARYPDRRLKVNALMKFRDIKQYAKPDHEGRKLIELAMKELRFSARAYYKILKISRTIADLAGEEMILADHIAEAIQYRSLDRQWWG